MNHASTDDHERHDDDGQQLRHPRRPDLSVHLPGRPPVLTPRAAAALLRILTAAVNAAPSDRYDHPGTPGNSCPPDARNVPGFPTTGAGREDTPR